MMIHLDASGTTSTSGTSAERAAPPERLADEVVLELALEDLPVGSTRLARVAGHRVCIARTDEGVFAVDHACPHEGYGLAQGSLEGRLLTCAWHNWKFDVTTGACESGEEDVTTHHVTVGDDGAIAVRLRERDPAADRERLLASLERALARNYVGQIARDTARLLAIGVEPSEIVAIGVEFGAPRGEYGWGHAIAALTDCLAMVDLFDGDQRTIPLVQGLSLVAHDERGRLPNSLPPSADPAEARIEVFLAAVEREDVAQAQAVVRAAIAVGVGPAELHRWFVGASSAHLLGYGHGAIYTHKAFELLDLIGWRHATSVLGHLVRAIVAMTREDTLPYFRPFGRLLDDAEVSRHAAAVRWDDAPADGSAGDAEADLRAAILGADRGLAARAALAALDDVPIDRVLDVVIDAVAERLLRHDASVEDDLDDDFGWLDITHGITYAHAARNLLHRLRRDGLLDDDAVDADRTRTDLVRLVLFCVFLANWTGRHEWHTRVGPRVATSLDDELAAVERDRVDAARRRAELVGLGEDLQRRSLDDVHTAPIHVEHAVKTARAAHLETARLGHGRVLAAVARYFDGPRRERGVRATIHRSIEFVGGRHQR